MTCPKMGPLHHLAFELDHGKYTHGMSTLTDEQLVGLLWLVGEFAMRASPGAFPLAGVVGSGKRRMIGALRALTTFRHKPMTMSEVREYILACARGDEP